MQDLLKILCLSAVCFIVTLTTTAAHTHAQADFSFGQEEEDEGPKVINPYDDKYKPDIKVDNTAGTSLVPNFIYYIGLIRKPGASPDDLNLQIFSPNTVVGCLTMESPTIEPVKMGTTLQLKITDGYIGPDTETIRYYHYNCEPNTGILQVGTTLSKQQLKEDGIKKLVIFSDAIGAFNDILLDISDERTHIISKIENIEKLGIPISASESTSTFWNYPENTMILSSSSTDLRNETVIKSLKNLARSKGLTPLDEILSGFEARHQQNNMLYVVDTQGIFKSKLSTLADSFILGSIKQSETYYGTTGPFEKPVKKAVIARMPGLYE